MRSMHDILVDAGEFYGKQSDIVNPFPSTVWYTLDGYRLEQFKGKPHILGLLEPVDGERLGMLNFLGSGEPFDSIKTEESKEIIWNARKLLVAASIAGNADDIDCAKGVLEEAYLQAAGHFKLVNSDPVKAQQIMDRVGAILEADKSAAGEVAASVCVTSPALGGQVLKGLRSAGNSVVPPPVTPV